MPLFYSPAEYLAAGGLPAPVARMVALSEPRLRHGLACAPPEFTRPIADLLCGPSVRSTVAELLAASGGSDPTIARALTTRERRPTPLSYLPVWPNPHDVQAVIADQAQASNSSRLTSRLLVRGCHWDIADRFDPTRFPRSFAAWIAHPASASAPPAWLREQFAAVLTARKHIDDWAVSSALTMHPELIPTVLAAGTPNAIAAASTLPLSPDDVRLFADRLTEIKGHPRTRAVRTLHRSPWVDPDTSRELAATLPRKARSELATLPTGDPAAFDEAEIDEWLVAAKGCFAPSVRSQLFRRPIVDWSVCLALLENPRLTATSAAALAEWFNKHASFRYRSLDFIDRVSSFSARWGNLPPVATLIRAVERSRPDWYLPITRGETPTGPFGPHVPVSAPMSETSRLKVPFARHAPDTVARFFTDELDDDLEAWALLFGLIDSFEGTIGDLRASVVALSSSPTTPEPIATEPIAA